MANKEIAGLPAMDRLRDDTLIPVYQPGAESRAQRMTGAQFRSYAEQSVSGYVQIVEGARYAAEAAAQTSMRAESGAIAAANAADGFASNAAAAQTAAESAKSATEGYMNTAENARGAAEAAQAASESARAAAEAARDQAQLAAEKDITDLDNGGKVYAADWVIRGGHPVLVLYESV